MPTQSPRRNEKPLNSSPTPSYRSLPSTPPTNFLGISDSSLRSSNRSSWGPDDVPVILSSMSRRSAPQPTLSISATASRESSRDRHSSRSPQSPSSLFKFRFSSEQREAHSRTESKVKLAQEVLSEVARTGVKVLGEVGEIVPVPGLAAAAKLLDNIWDAVEQVDSNRLACLRLTERCAEILLAVHAELQEAGAHVASELSRPMLQLEDALLRFSEFLDSQKDMPLWRRLVKREDILRDIQSCDEALGDALFVFNSSILVRILKSLLALPQNSSIDGMARETSMLFSMDGDGQSTSHEESQDPELDEMLPLISLPADDTATEETDHLRDHLRLLQEHQNELDQARDLADIRSLLIKALNASTDSAMIRILQLGKHDMPAAVRSLLRALESQHADCTHHRTPLIPERDLKRIRGLTWPLDGTQKDMLDGEYWHTEQFDYDKLARGVKLDLPCLTIDKSELSRQELVGTGFFSNVYKGTWRNRTVAIKILDRSTSQEDFIAEAELWRSLNHLNVLRLYGTSSLEARDGSSFFVSPYMRYNSLSRYLKHLEWELEAPNGNTGFSTDPEVRRRDLHSELLEYMVDIAKGMEYLHAHHIFHGDLKGANVLVDNNFRCVLADFGHSKFDHQVTYDSPRHNHGFRWQSPELMRGRSLLTKENDVYAYAITLVEILLMGSLPWPNMPDDLVKVEVLGKSYLVEYSNKWLTNSRQRSQASLSRAPRSIARNYFAAWKMLARFSISKAYLP
ncbi:hypothetical protein VNI00_005322 [Paramarasmius palmivorus]|uniref:Protein kinase domain-containing protein n=1 Tax=Paramarasmius palmivorus TaxID=297713 RepID=A0AAW0DEQ3_9AGAR